MTGSLLRRWFPLNKTSNSQHNNSDCLPRDWWLSSAIITGFSIQHLTPHSFWFHSRSWNQSKLNVIFFQQVRLAEKWLKIRNPSSPNQCVPPALARGNRKITSYLWEEIVQCTLAVKVGVAHAKHFCPDSSKHYATNGWTDGWMNNRDDRLR